MSEVNVPETPAEVSMVHPIKCIIDDLAHERAQLLEEAERGEFRVNHTRRRAAELEHLIVEWKRILRAEEES